MGSNRTKVISVRISNEAAAAIELEADRTGKSIKELIEGFGLDISEGRIRCDNDSVIPTEEYLGDIGNDSEYEELGFAGVLRMLRKREYPDNVIKRMNEQQMIQIGDMPKYRAGRSVDWGC